MAENSDTKSIEKDEEKEPILEEEHSELYNSLSKIIDESRISEFDFERRLYSHDVAPLPKIMEMGFKMVPDIIVRPKTAIEVSNIIKFAMKKQIPVIPRGGGCGAMGGAVPVMGGITLDMASMDEILKIDEENFTVTVEPGITWSDLYETLLKKGYLIGVYPSSAPSASIAGWINSGGIGIGSYKYGGAESQILALEIVLPEGDIASFGIPNLKSTSLVDNLRYFFVGAEGTLGVYTKITLRIYPAPDEIRTISYSFPGVKELCEAVYDITRTSITPLHMSYFDKTHFDYLRLLGNDLPQIGAMLNVALEGTNESINAEESVLDKLLKKHNGKKQNKKLSSHEWEERYFEFRTKRLGPSFMLNEALIPVNKLYEMILGTKKLLKKMGLEGAMTGTICGPNTAAFLPYWLTDERKLRSMTSMAFTKKVGDLSFKFGGRPVGLGIFFSGNLKKMHQDGADVMKNFKAALDPYDIMNPGKLTEGMTKFGIPVPAFGMSFGMNMLAAMSRIPGMKIKLKLEPTSEAE
jgi:glycolate oxidase